MKNQRYRYRRSDFKSFTSRPDCPECGTTGHKIQEASTRDVPFIDQVGGSLSDYTKSVYMCTVCGNAIGYADKTPGPEDVIKAHERPDLSAKYEGNIKHA
jgi:hypothetical protein